MNVQDRRRILGPAGAKPLAFLRTEQQEKPQRDVRTPRYTTRVTANSNGSSLVETESMSLLTAVYGPRPTREQQFRSNGTVNVVLSRSERFPTGQLKELGAFLVSVLESCVCLEKYPKSGIDVFVSFNIEDCASLADYLVQLIPGIVLALVDAGIEMTDLVCAGEHEGTVVCFGDAGNKIVGVWADEGPLPSDNVAELINACRDGYTLQRGLVSTFLQQ
ncbi:exosome non-catalytic core subunit MTR3 KNAG_0D03240 [Huiozyma naganishii CBS 8797]|uniref:Exoribonuclease phosphorolytic domain-containing protein n=1 Tax=Huiozyma naganishii (strain ATCC MYA-139 / BCRC 22969 / CBS 8797 / KCTC 17520 / NBRC 10181 / NCYC 3082 / Yp74L-3) TaxID=1071383 RepID=J7R5F3_HUIN7|nr:hypothetical protein KNAG_0D03240 [Kazachstania naganishii CBS 8797]CCK70070.1 hypothetical protein KNAG_0D03240 [Kazachstania naganishii CBS 8797]